MMTCDIIMTDDTEKKVTTAGKTSINKYLFSEDIVYYMKAVYSNYFY